MGNSLIKNTTIYALGDIIPKLLGFISFPILTNFLSPEEYGIVNYVNTINVFLTTLGFLCLNTYYLVHYYREKDDYHRKLLLGNLYSFVSIINIFGLIITFIAGPYLLKHFGSNIDFFPYVAVGIITNFFNLFAVLPCALYRLQEKPLFLTILNIVRGSIAFCLTLLLVVKFRFNAIGILISDMIISITFGMLFMKIAFNNMVLNINWSQIKIALKFSLPLLPGSLSYFFVSLFDRVLIDKYVGLSALGIYSTASSIALLLNIVSNGAYKSFEPFIFKIYGKKDFNSQINSIYNGYCYILLLCVLGLSIYSKEFLAIFSGKQFHTAYIYVPPILIGVFCSSINMLFSTIITAKGKTKINSLISIIGGSMSLLFNTILLPKYGIIAATVSSALSLGTSMSLGIYFSNIRICYTRTFLSIMITTMVIYYCVYLNNIESLMSSLLFKSILFLLSSIVLLYTMEINILPLLSIFKKNRTNF